MASDDAAVEVSLIVRLESTTMRIAPLQFSLGRPRLVRALVDALPCRVGDTLLRAIPQPLAASAIDMFVDNELLSQNRSLPTITFSRDNDTGAFLADPAITADMVAGLANVYTFEDKWATYALSARMGRMLSCFHGAVRIYWPGLTLGSNPLHHPLYLPTRLQLFRQEGIELSEHLLRRLAGISAVRIVEGRVARSVRLALQEEERQRRRRDLVDYEDLKQLLEVADQEEQRLRGEVEAEQKRSFELEVRVDELEDEVADLKRNLADLSRYSAPAATGIEVSDRNAEVEPRTVREALDMAEGRFGEYLRVWPSARDAATRSAFARPAQVYQAFLALSEVAETYFRSRTSGEPMGSWEEAFETRGFKYAPRDSETTMNMYGSERTFTCDGRRIRMEKHLTIGGGSRQNCLQIYFEVDDSQRLFVVGYCGMHLQYYGMTT